MLPFHSEPACRAPRSHHPKTAAHPSGKFSVPWEDRDVLGRQSAVPGGRKCGDSGSPPQVWVPRTSFMLAISAERGWQRSQGRGPGKHRLKQRKYKLRLPKKNVQSLEKVPFCLESTSQEQQALSTSPLLVLLFITIHLSANNYSPSRHPHLNLLIMLLLGFMSTEQ